MRRPAVAFLAVGVVPCVLAVGALRFAAVRRSASAEAAPASASASGPAEASLAAEAESTATVATGRPQYEYGEPILVKWRGFRSSTGDWITVVPASVSATRYDEWIWTGRPQGVHNFKGLRAGHYEVRGYLDWPRGGYRIAARHPFAVVGEPPAELPEYSPPPPEAPDGVAR